MKRILFFLLIISFHGFSQSNNALSWYKMMTGKIDQLPITMHLHKAGHSFGGYYYYESQQQPIYFFGDDTSVKGKIQLVAYGEPEQSEYFLFAISGDKFVGTWKKTEKSKPFGFTANETSMPFRFSYVFTDGLVKLRPKLKNSPEANFEAASVWPAGNNVADSFLKRIIRKQFASEKSGEDIGRILLDQKKDFFKNYISDLKEETDKQVAESSTAYSYDQSSKLMIVFQSSKMISFAQLDYSYSGGAHGMYGTNYVCIDLVNKKEITLDQVLTKEGMKQLRALLEKNFRVQYKLKATDDLTEGGLFENRIEPNKNFFLTGKGIGFAFNPYEIGPYAMGEIDIFIPFKELQEQLQPGFRKLVE